MDRITMHKKIENLYLSVKKSWHESVRVDDEPLFRRKIGDMVSGEVGWAVPWALSNGKLREDYHIHEGRWGTATLRVCCVKPHEYETHLRPDQEIYHLPPLTKQTTNRIVITPEICLGCGASAWIKLSRTEMQCAYCGRVICP